MKKRSTKKYLTVFVIFTVMMIASLVFFMYENKVIDINNQANYLLKDLYELSEGDFTLKNGVLYKDDYIASEKKYFEANGNINIDKYGNVRFILYYDDMCIKKTYMGNVLVGKTCFPNKEIKVKVNKNNSVISFVSNTKNLEYKISSEDDFKGVWVSEDYKDNIVLKKYSEGTNYIWFKDSEGNLSRAISFNVDCLSTSKSEYNPEVFYCSGSTVRLDNIDYVVIKDSNTNIKLMKLYALDEELSHCVNSDDNYCFYKESSKNTYNWENSYINYYLNNVFVKELSDETFDKLEMMQICNDVNSKCNNESCIGVSKEVIERNDYTCDSYTESLIKLISYDEFNYVYYKASNKKVLNGNYWSINSINKDYGSTVQYDLSFYIYEDLMSKKAIKPVILLNKKL